MRIKLQYTIKAILSGVDESIIDKLNFGNSFIIQKDSLTNGKLCKEFDYTFIGIRRIYELSKLNQKLEVALLTKKAEKEYTVKKIIIDNVSTLNYDQIYPYISEIEDEELKYIDETMRNIRLFSENCFNIKEILFKFKIINLKDNSTIFDNIYSKIPLPDKIYDNISKLHIENELEANKLNDFIKNINAKVLSSNFSPELLSQACFLYDQSYTSSLETIRFLVSIIGLESLLINSTTELSYKFSRNGAMLLSTSKEEYYEYLKILKKIYMKRSKYVHAGVTNDLTSDDVKQAREILRKVINTILIKNISKEELIKELDIKGYI